MLEATAIKFKNGLQSQELIKVFEKIKDGIWVYNGVFELHDAWIEESESRNVFKFKLVVTYITVDQKEKKNLKTLTIIEWLLNQ